MAKLEQSFCKIPAFHVAGSVTLPRRLETDCADISKSMFASSAGFEKKGEWLLSNVCVIVIPPIELSTAAIM
jgi:hypothetical protein